MVEQPFGGGDTRWHCAKCRHYTEECICPTDADQFRPDRKRLRPVIKRARSPAGIGAAARL